MLKAVQSRCSLGDIHAAMEVATKQATAFMCKCYNISNVATMTEKKDEGLACKDRKKECI